ncbi:NUDIX domain-containing protein [Clostridium guangxiense]|uniref:NUDIX domain-containing protein n=1 Tax=Clostridium guangxiense TaxID=1662055 RepID=UPI001E5597A7|nr:NUDIX domain-containing protein [Clostridium guangxiense]MCD2346803.1 NUDIX domain-containing protein [Clostridium guangxiense]
MKYKYCPICGKKLKEKYSWDEGGVPYCSTDDIMFFDTPKPCIIAAVIKDDKVLLLKQNYTFKDSKVLVSGYVANNETVEETVLREIREETGIIAKEPKYLGSYYLAAKEIIMLTFMVKYVSGEIVKSEEVDGAEFVNLDNALCEMKKDKIGSEVVKKVIGEVRGEL